MGKIDELNQNGSGNIALYVKDSTLFVLDYVHNSGLIRIDLDGTQRQIIPANKNPLYFKLSNQKIFFVDTQYALWACDFLGQNLQEIVSGNEESVFTITVNQDAAFVITKRRGHKTLRMIPQTLGGIDILVQDKDFANSIAADDDYVYFSNPLALCRVNIHTKAIEKFTHKLCEHVRNLMIYENYLVFISDDYLGSTTSRIILLDRYTLTLREVYKGEVKELNCYVDNLYFTDKERQYIYHIPIQGGTPTLLCKISAENLDLSFGILSFIDCSEGQLTQVSLEDVNTELKRGLPARAKEILKYNYIFCELERHAENPEMLESMSLDDILSMVFSVHEFEREFYDYVAMFKCPYVNLRKEDFESLISAAKANLGSDVQPILFVDGSTLGKNRKKGFIVATDGIYFNGRRVAFTYKFECESVFAGIKVRTEYSDYVEYACSMFKSAREELADLINIIFVYSFY